jgi:DNA-directed RNA polymerase subunit RPC12/RpoP
MTSRDNLANEAAKRRAAAQERREAAEAGEAPWPDDPTKRTPQEQAKVEAYELAVEWLREKWINRSDDEDAPRCPYCNNNVWSVGVPTRLLASPIYDAETIGGAFAADLLPSVFPVMCTNCGHTVFVSAVLPGIVPPPGDPS